MAEKYDLIVIGGGSAGLTAVDFAVKLGLKTALVDKQRIGGDCTWTGCVPSKALLHVAKVVQTARTASHFGVILPPPQVDMRQVRDYVQGVIADIYQHETPQILQSSGVDVFLGGAQFLDAHTIQAGTETLTAKKFLIATGARPFIPSIPDIDEVPFVTYEQFFDNDKLPRRLLVLGAGPTGVEMAQAYGRLGAEVTLIDEALLPGVDPEVAAIMEPLLAGEGVQFVAGLVRLVQQDGAEIIVFVNEVVHRGDMLLVATGRRPIVHELALKKAGVHYSNQGIVVDKALRTSVGHIFAAGDVVAGSPQFTHFAGWQAYRAVRNAFLPGHDPGFSDAVPRVIYTDPEIAQVGLTESEARDHFGDSVAVTQTGLDRVDRAITDHALTGFVKMVHRRNGRLLGATIVAPRAGEIVTEFTMALQHGMKIHQLAELFHAYPSYAMGVQLPAAARAADDVLAGTIGKLLRRLAARA